MLLSGKPIGGVDAQKMGVVDEAYSYEKLMPRAFEIGKELAKKDLKTYNEMKRMIKKNLIKQIRMEIS